jgi:hypothetical protein
MENKIRRMYGEPPPRPSGRVIILFWDKNQGHKDDKSQRPEKPKSVPPPKDQTSSIRRHEPRPTPSGNRR